MSEEKSKQSFVMYASFYDAAMGLNDVEFREYILALKDYALYGIEHTSSSPMVNALLVMAQPLLEAAAKRREQQVKNGDYGIFGGRPRKGETAEEYKARKLKTLNASMGLQSETLYVDGKGNIKDNAEDKGNADLNVTADADVNADGDGETGIIKNTNVVLQNDSFSTNSGSSFEFNHDGGSTKHGEGPRRDERARQAGNNASNGSDFIRRITLEDQDDDAAFTPPSDQYRNYVGRLEDFLRYDEEPDYSGMTDADMMDTVKGDIDAAITCERREGTSQRYSDHIHRAKKIYMRLNGCDEETAKRGITRLYREREKTL